MGRCKVIKLRSLLIIVFITFICACGHTIKYSKLISPVPEAISVIKVMDVKGCCRTDYIKNLLTAKLLESQKFELDDDAKYALFVNVEGYHPRYRRYIALSAKIIDIKTDKVVWAASISGIASRVFIDEVITNTINELIREMTQSR